MTLMVERVNFLLIQFITSVFDADVSNVKLNSFFYFERL